MDKPHQLKYLEVGKPHQQVLASLTSACGASLNITTKQGAMPAPSCPALWCMPWVQ